MEKQKFSEFCIKRSLNKFPRHYEGRMIPCRLAYLYLYILDRVNQENREWLEGIAGESVEKVLEYTQKIYDRWSENDYKTALKRHLELNLHVSPYLKLP